MKIILNNNKSRLVGLTKQILAIREHEMFAIRAKGAFYSPAFRRRQWDGYIRFITDSGVIDTGKVPQFIKIYRELYPESPVNIIDERGYEVDKITIPKRIGKFEVRGYQKEAIESITNNQVEDAEFPRGIIGAATNAGKTLISAGIHLSYNLPTLFFIQSKELLDQAIEEIPQFLPGKVGILASGHKLEWKPFMIVMVKTAYSRISMVEGKFARYPVVLVDECDLATSKTYRAVLNRTYNSYVRVGLSGSAMADPRQREKNERLRSIFGDVVYEIKNRTLIDAGWSSNVKVYMWEGNVDVKVPGDFRAEYTLGIEDNHVRNKKIIGRALNHLDRGRKPILIITKTHRHVRNLYKLLLSEKPEGIRVSWVHHEAEHRKKAVKQFKEGKIDILVGSYILKRGKNFPLMKAIICAGGGDSLAQVLQILGRATRKHASKEYTILDDFYDKGRYLLRHSKHRFKKYQEEKLEVYKKF